MSETDPVLHSLNSTIKVQSKVDWLLKINWPDFPFPISAPLKNFNNSALFMIAHKILDKHIFWIAAGL